jgi:hypothetical protein
LIRWDAVADDGSYEYLDKSVRPNRTYYYKLEVVGSRGSLQHFGPFELRYIAQFALENAAPNPFNPETTIRFTIPEDGDVSLIVYDVLGRRVRTLVNGKKRADHYEVIWDGSNDQGNTVASGVYFYRLKTASRNASKKMVFVK